MGYTIMTDSTCDLPVHLVQEMGICVVPLVLVVDGVAYDQSAYSMGEFYNMLRAGKKLSTSAVNVAQFVASMTPILDAGEDVLYIGFTNALSATCKSAELAAVELSSRYPERNILAIDSQSGCLGQGLLVSLTAEKRAQGASIEEAAQFVRETGSQICHWFTLSDLHHLKRGGRMSVASALLGSVLHIKPILHMDEQCGLTVVGKARGRKAALRTILQAMTERIIAPETQTIYIGHADCPEEAAFLAQMVREALPVKDILIGTVGPVTATHVGPDALSLFFLGGPR